MQYCEALDVAIALISNDVSDRITRFVDSTWPQGSPRAYARRINEHEGIIPPTISIRERWGKWTTTPSLFFVDEDFVTVRGDEPGRFIYAIETVNHGFDWRDWHGWKSVHCNFIPSEALIKAVWSCCAERTVRFPWKALHEFRTVKFTNKALSTLTDFDIGVNFGVYSKRDEVKSLDRSRSEGFIAEIRLPGSHSWLRLATVENASTAISRLTELQEEAQGVDTNSRTLRSVELGGGQVSTEDDIFLAELKSHCYAIKSRFDKSSADEAFEMYKKVARYLKTRRNSVYNVG